MPGAVVGIMASSRAVAAGFSPADIAGLKLWLKADSLSLVDGDPVGTWADQSGNGFHATAAGGARPTYKTGILNGKPVVRWDLSGANLMACATGSFGLLNTLTIAAVLIPGSVASGGPHQFWFMTCGANPTSAWNVSITASTSIMGWWMTGTGAVVYATTANADGTPVLLTVTADNSASPKTRFYRNAIADGTDIGGITTNAQAGYQLGNFPLAPADSFRRDMAELVVYDSALGTIDRGNLETYLMAKYGL